MKGTSIIDDLLPLSPVELFGEVGVLNCVRQRVGDRIVIEHIFRVGPLVRLPLVVVRVPTIEAMSRW